MDDDFILAIYSDIAGLTGQMLAAARNGEWDTLIALEKACSTHFARLPADENGRPRSAEYQRRKAELIRGVLAEDAQIRLLVEPWQSRLAELIDYHGQQRRLLQAYKPGE
jgi:flagellar protein FliT